MKLTCATLFIAALMFVASSCTKMQHCHCQVILPTGPDKDTVVYASSTSFEDSKKHAEEFCEGEFQEGMEASNPKGEVTCSAVEEE